MKLYPLLLTPLLLGACARAAGIHHRNVRRDTTDTCAYFDEETLTVPVFGQGDFIYQFGLDGCYCLSTIAETIVTNGLAARIIGLGHGDTIPETIAAIETNVNAASDQEECTYPENSTPACTSGDVCGFTCTNGFTPLGGDCVCVSPLVIVDGVCVTPGSSVDTCAYFDNIDLVVGSITYADGLDGCYCLSSIFATLLDNGFAAEIVARGGLGSLPAAEAAIEDAINSAADEGLCVYPPNSAPACSSDNVCDFTCTNHFTLSGGDCVCVSPRVLSDGACVIPGSPGLRRRDMFKDDSGCGLYEDACGIPGEPSAWECLDTRSALDSCGGCVYPPPAGLVAGVPAARRGKDCTEIPHAMEIACRVSKCVIDRCNERYIVSADRSGCILSGSATSNPGILMHQSQ